MFLHPLQGFDLVLQAIVQTAPFLNLFPSQKSMRANAIIESNNHNAHISRSNQPRPVIIWRGEIIKTASLDPDKNRQLGSVPFLDWGIDLHEKTVFRRPIRNGILSDWDTQRAMLHVKLVNFDTQNRTRVFVLCFHLPELQTEPPP